MNAYGVLIIIVAVAVSLLTNARIAYTMGNRWSMLDGNHIFMLIVSTVISGFLTGTVSTYVVGTSGNFYGLLTIPGSMVGVALAWAYLIGFNKAIAVILLGLVNRFEKI